VETILKTLLKELVQFVETQPNDGAVTEKLTDLNQFPCAQTIKENQFWALIGTTGFCGKSLVRTCGKANA
jgi:hypothetical protein